MSLANSNKTVISLILLDDDPIFLLGLREVLNVDKFKDINIIATGRISDFDSLLKEYQGDLWVVALDFNKYPNKVKTFFNSLHQLDHKYSDLSFLILMPWGFDADFSSFPMIKGFCLKNEDVDELVKIFRLCSKGEKYFNSNVNNGVKTKNIKNWFYGQCQGGLKQIQKEIININDYMEGKILSIGDSLYWQGRKRELKFTKWLIVQFIPNNNPFVNKISLDFNNYYQDKNEENYETKLELETNHQITINNSPKNIYDLTLTKIQSSVKNCTLKLQSIDILLDSKKQELFMIILQEWLILIKDIKTLNLQNQDLLEKTNIFIKDLWQNSTIKFLSRYYILNSDTDNLTSYDLVEYVLQESVNYQDKKLFNLPFLFDIINYQIEEKDLIIDSQIYQYNSDLAKNIEEIILDNIIITMANYIVDFILNKFSDNLSIRQNIFNLELKSSRKIAMFRNNLIWVYRLEKYWYNPKNIFEDQYQMLKLTDEGIKSCIITHPRYQELNQLKGIPWAITILIELRDSLSKGFKSLENSIGKGIVYLLTEVLGKGIGLIGKGILQSIGNRIKN